MIVSQAVTFCPFHHQSWSSHGIGHRGRDAPYQNLGVLLYELGPLEPRLGAVILFVFDFMQILRSLWVTLFLRLYLLYWLK